jgi:aqualysin 1
MKTSNVLVFAIVTLAACRDELPSGPSSEPAAQLSRTLSAELIPGQYVVVFQNSVADVDVAAKRLAGKHRGKLKHTYKTALKAMAVELPDSAVAELRRDPDVKYIEQNQVFHAIAQPTTQPAATFGLDRIDQRRLPLSNSYSYILDGSGVRVYILDTGINFGHRDFGGRAVLGIDAIGTDGVDCNGHGTHVAGTVGGTTYGVAKKVRLVAVRVLDCGGRGDLFSVLDGIDWVTSNRVLPAVANMSLSGGFSATLNDAITRSISSGVTYVVAAGNAAADACSFTPSSVFPAIVVGATGQDDAFAPFSNSGDCVDLEAPGVEITSDWIGSTDATGILSGTSMASPHAAGAAALYLSAHPNASTTEVQSQLTSNATAGVITGLPGTTKSRLLYTGFLTADLWQPRAPLPRARRELAVGNANGIIYAIGGIAASGTVAEVTAYDPIGNAWSSKAPLPSARQSGNGASYVGGRLYVAGGLNASGVLTKTLYGYNTTTNLWFSRANMPVLSGCGLSASIGGKLYVFSGCTGTTAATAGLLHRFDPGTNLWTALKAAPHAHRYPAGGVINGKLYVAGGVDASGFATGTLDVYDPATNAWTTLQPSFFQRRVAGGAVVNGNLYLIGGRDAAGVYMTSVEAYNPATNRWTSRGALAQGRSGLGAAVSNGLIFAVGGRNNTTVFATNQAYWP